MSNELEADVAWLRELEKRSWREHPGEKYNPKKLGWREDLAVPSQDGSKALELFRKHQSVLLFEPGSGVFGFGVCISAFRIVWPTYPGVPMELEHIITLTSKQLFPDRRAGDQGPTYELFASFTHTAENKRLRKEADIKEPLRDYSYYDY